MPRFLCKKDKSCKTCAEHHVCAMLCRNKKPSKRLLYAQCRLMYPSAMNAKLRNSTEQTLISSHLSSSLVAALQNALQDIHCWACNVLCNVLREFLVTNYTCNAAIFHHNTASKAIASPSPAGRVCGSE